MISYFISMMSVFIINEDEIFRNLVLMYLFSKRIIVLQLSMGFLLRGVFNTSRYMLIIIRQWLLRYYTTN